MPTPTQLQDFLDRGGEGAALDLLASKDRRAARMVVDRWLRAPAEGPVLDAILSFPDYRVRRRLLVCRSLAVESAGEEHPLRFLPAMSIRLNLEAVLYEVSGSGRGAEERRLWTDRVLPHLFQDDPSYEVRYWAAYILDYYCGEYLDALVARPEVRLRFFQIPRWSPVQFSLVQMCMNRPHKLTPEECSLLLDRFEQSPEQIPATGGARTRYIARLLCLSGVEARVVQEPFAFYERLEEAQSLRLGDGTPVSVGEAAALLRQVF